MSQLRPSALKTASWPVCITSADKEKNGLKHETASSKMHRELYTTSSFTTRRGDDAPSIMPFSVWLVGKATGRLFEKVSSM